VGLSKRQKEHIMNSFSTIPDQGQTTSVRRAGIIILLLALLFTLTNYVLYITLNYPAILLMKAPLANPPGMQMVLLALLGFVGLMACSVLLFIISRWVTPYLEEKWRRQIILMGSIAGAFWAVGSVLGLVLLLLWSTATTVDASIPAMSLLLFTELGAPLLLAYWTVTLAWQLRAHRVSASLGAIGLLLVCLRSLVWGLNALLPPESGFYTLAGVLNILAVIGSSLWLVWLGSVGIHFLIRGQVNSSAQVRQTNGGMQAPNRIKRRGFLRLGVGLGVGVAGTAFVLARANLTMTNSPFLESDEVPAEPSLAATFYYLLARIFLQLNPIDTRPSRHTINPEKLSFPFSVSFTPVNAGGIPAQFVQAGGATNKRVLLYLHGGGFISSASEQHYFFTARLSQRTGTSVLMPQYRLAPEHPFPAGLQDCVMAYRWLRSQGFAASQIVIAGESTGGNLTLATALALRESGEELPAALVAISAPFDLATVGPDPLLGKLVPVAYNSYTNHGAIDASNPLVSPLYANVGGLPPTFLLAGTEEWMRRDTMLMAERMRRAGVEVKLEIWPGMWHAFPLFLSTDTVMTENGVFPEARLAIEHIVKFIRQHQSSTLYNLGKRTRHESLLR
jgi:acetyl esterase/lipase